MEFSRQDLSHISMALFVFIFIQPETPTSIGGKVKASFVAYSVSV